MGKTKSILQENSSILTFNTVVEQPYSLFVVRLYACRVSELHQADPFNVTIAV